MNIDSVKKAVGIAGTNLVYTTPEVLLDIPTMRRGFASCSVNSLRANWLHAYFHFYYVLHPTDGVKLMGYGTGPNLINKGLPRLQLGGFYQTKSPTLQKESGKFAYIRGQLLLFIGIGEPLLCDWFKIIENWRRWRIAWDVIYCSKHLHEIPNREENLSLVFEGSGDY